MIQNTFVHLPNIGLMRERALWNQGITSWDDFLKATSCGNLSNRCFQAAVPVVQQSLIAMAAGNVSFFTRSLPSSQMWRLYPEFSSRVLYLDIETTGMSLHHHDVTIIGAFANGKPSLFVDGVNLHEFPEFVSQYPIIVTFNGATFDLPFLRNRFPQATLNQAQIDLRFLFSSLGYGGGLKSIERVMGIRRDPRIQDIDGFEAVRLWQRYCLGEKEALKRLATYNLTDVVNLVTLAKTAVGLKMQQTVLIGQTDTSDEIAIQKHVDHDSIERWCDNWCA